MIVTLASAWQTVSLLFWFFPPESAAGKFGLSIVPVILNLVIYGFHSEDDPHPDENQKVSATLGVMFAFLISYIFQAAVW
jgi:hypothetical protein